MSKTPKPQSRRARPAKPALSRDLIVETALELLRTEGYEATSMRRVAQALDTGPASLYVYVANRDELLELMLDLAITAVPIPVADPTRWREQLKDLLKALRRMMSEDYPGITRLAMATIPTGPGALALAESMLALMKAGGMSDEAAGYACDILSLYVHAQALEATLYLERSDGDGPLGPEYFMSIADRYRSLSPDQYPNLSSLVPQLMAGDGDQRFDVGLDVLINGLLATPLEGRLQHWF
ncbi:MAG: TetR/AcrR family transcriptional regulator [Gaiellales bacterium]